MRIGLVPIYEPMNDCTGCTFLWQDLVILVGILTFLFILLTLALLRTRGVLDPLGYRKDLIRGCALTFIAWLGYILAVVDPGELMQTQHVDWFLFECLAAVLLHCHRCPLQLYRVSRIHKKFQEQGMNLIDILQGDARGALMFEKYLIGELASENLLFWREGVKYKMNFDKGKAHDLEYSQQVGKVLFRTFVSKHAQLPM